MLHSSVVAVSFGISSRQRAGKLSIRSSHLRCTLFREYSDRHHERNLPRQQCHHLRAARRRCRRPASDGAGLWQSQQHSRHGIAGQGHDGWRTPARQRLAGRGRRPPDVQQRRHRRHPDGRAVGPVRAARTARCGQAHRQPAAVWRDRAQGRAGKPGALEPFIGPEPGSAQAARRCTRAP